jgi:hypothetical protein
LFATKEIIVDAAFSFGFVLKASHDENFGKSAMYLKSRGKIAVLENPEFFTELFSQMSPFLICALGDDGRTIGNVTVDVNYDHSLSFTVHTFCLTDQNTTITLNGAQLERLRTHYVWTMQYHLRTLKRIELLAVETFRGIVTEARIYAQGQCSACKSYAPHESAHSCIEVSDERLDTVLRKAMVGSGNWSQGAAITQINMRLAPHIEFFRQQFRASMEINLFMRDTYKINPFPNYIL